MRFARLLVLTAAFFPSLVRAQGIITTLAGADWIFPRTTIHAALAPLGRITFLAVDAGGNIYAADPDNHVVVRIAPDRGLSVVAGNGMKGFSGDGGPAVNASLDSPVGVAVDAAGSIYIGDTRNQRVRKVTPDGIIRTVAGIGLQGFAGDSGPATKAVLNDPQSLAVDASGNLYISDAHSLRIRKVTPSGIISTVAGNLYQLGYSGDGGPATNASFNWGVACFVGQQWGGMALPCPFGLAIALDGAGNLYIADSGNNRVRKVDSKGVITTFAGTGQRGYSGDGGPALQAQMVNPIGVAADAAGNVYIGDLDGRVRKVSPAGIITTVAGDQGAYNAPEGSEAIRQTLNIPVGLALDAGGGLLIADSGNRKIRRVTPTGTMVTVAGTGAFQYLGDNVPAISAALNRPIRVALDSAGNVYIADTDNFRVRKVSPQGTITTVAGTGKSQWSPDGLPAIEAGLTLPMGVAIDNAGNLLIADTYAQGIRRVSSDGLIRTVPGTDFDSILKVSSGAPLAGTFPFGVAADSAGNVYIPGLQRIYRISPAGIATALAGKLDCVRPNHDLSQCTSSSGDGGPAIEANFNWIYDVAVDAAGNVYIAEFGNHRIRRVTPDGKIDTFAGNGKGGFSGDGGRARDASLLGPTGVTADTFGNVFIADSKNHRIRKVDPQGIITTVAGNGKMGGTGDGGLATEASLSYPSDVKVDRAGNLYITDAANNRIRVVRPVAGLTYQSAPAALEFTAVQGASAPAAQNITLSSAVPVRFTASAATGSGGNWLAVSPASGQSPGSVQVSIDHAKLAPGSYEGTLTISVPAATPATRTVAVKLKVDAPPAQPELSLETRPLTFSLIEGAGETSAQLGVTNRGGGKLEFTARAEADSGGTWLAVTPAGGAATPAEPVTLTVTVRPQGLAAGTYQGRVTVTGAGASRSVPVTLTISVPQRVILLSQTGLSFHAVAGGGIPLPQSFGILNLGQGSLSWTARASTLAGGSNWLQIAPASGTVTRPYLDVNFVNVVIDPAGLAAGEYHGQVSVSAAAANSPQSVSVVLNVMPRGSTPGPELQPTGLVFTGAAGNNPGSQDVKVANPRADTDRFISGAIGNWYTHTPGSAAVVPDKPAIVRVFPDFAGLAAGVSRGTITLQFDDGTARTISLLSVVAPAGATGESAAKGGVRAASGCSSSNLRVLFTSLAAGFVATAGQGKTVEAKIVDDCGNPLVPDPGRAGVQVIARFSNGDPQKELAHIGAGVWTGTWNPLNRADRVTADVTALYIGGPVRQGGQASITGRVQAGGGPLLSSAGVVHSATARSGPLAVGGLATVYGANLAGAGSAATEVYLDGRSLPLLYTSSGQVNVQVPYDLAVNTQHQIMVRRDDALSVPDSLPLTTAQPGIFTKDLSGSGQGIVVKSDMLTLAEPGTPALRNEVIVIYATGLGPVTPAVRTGEPAPFSPLSRTANAVTATIGGRPAQVQFSGLTPGFMGLYQINAVVPNDVTPGDAVPVILTVAGQPSPPVTIAVR